MLTPEAPGGAQHPGEFVVGGIAMPEALTTPPAPPAEAPPDAGLPTAGTLAALAALGAGLAACGGGGGGDGPASSPVPPAPPAPPPSRRDAVRFLTQASFGPTGPAQVDALVAQGFDAWLNAQMRLPMASHLAAVETQRGRDQALRDVPKRIPEEASYEALWQQWLAGEDQLRARMAWALLQVFVISNVAPDIRPVAMSSYTDLLQRHAFGNWRALLQDVTLHPAMGYYLNLLESEKEDPRAGTHPNENYAREVLQLFSIGLVQLNLDGSVQRDANGQPLPTYDEAVVKGFAKAFSGWSYGGLNNQDPRQFHEHDDNDERLWFQPMQAWPAFHDSGEKTLLNGRVLPAGQTPEKDLGDALDAIFAHPNVPPFFARQLIQRLVTSNPSPAYIERVARTFVNDGLGVRGNLAATLRAVLLDPEARGDTPPLNFGKQREPVVRFANYLRALNAKSPSGQNRIHYLDGSDDALGQSPLLAPSVFNFYSPGYRPAGPIAAAGLVAPEFHITGETTVAGSLNFFAELVHTQGYGWPEAHRLVLDVAPLVALAGDANALVDRLDLLFFTLQMKPGTRARLLALVNAISANDRNARVEAALVLTALQPDFVIQH